jgi:hypothetical protein
MDSLEKNRSFTPPICKKDFARVSCAQGIYRYQHFRAVNILATWNGTHRNDFGPFAQTLVCAFGSRSLNSLRTAWNQISSRRVLSAVDNKTTDYRTLLRCLFSTISGLVAQLPT